MNILIIEDNIIYRNNLKKDLEKSKYNVDLVEDFTQVENLNFVKYDIVIIDINLPMLDGRNLIQVVKSSSEAKVIMLTSTNYGKVEYDSLKLGADDYIVKPHYMPVLDLKIKQLTNIKDKIMIINSHKLNVDTLMIDEQIQLTVKEYKIIICLYNKHGEECSKNEILRILWESDFFVELGALYTLISRLRKKLKHTNIVISNTKGGYKIDL